MLSVAYAAMVLAAPNIPAVEPPFGGKIVSLAGWVIFGIGLSLVLAAGVAIAHLAWAHYHHRAGGSALSLGLVLLCGIAFGSLGAIMNGLF